MDEEYATDIIFKLYKICLKAGGKKTHRIL